MRAIDLAEQIPTIGLDTTGAEAARLVAEFRLQGLVVVGREGLANAVIAANQILGLIVPGYVRDDPALAHVIGEELADDMCRRLTSTTIGEMLDVDTLRPRALPTVDPDTTLLEMASLLSEEAQPLAVVRDRAGVYHGVVTVSRLLAAVAVLAGQDSNLVQRRLTRDIADRGRADRGQGQVGVGDQS